MRKKIIIGIGIILIGGLIYSGINLFKGSNLGVKGFRPSGYSTTLASSLAEGGSETTLKVNSLTLPDDTTLNDSYYGDLLILTVGEGDGEEKIAVGALNESTLTFTIISRGLEYGRWASSTDNIKQHLPGERVYVSDDDHWVYNQLPDLDATTTISQLWTFLTFPKSGSLNPSDNYEFATKYYVDNTATSGAPQATSLIDGLVELATRAEAALGSIFGDSGATLVLTSSIATSSADVATSSVVVTQSTGLINPNFYQSNPHTFSATTTLADITNGHTVMGITATTTITGTTTPQPVYATSSDGKLLLCDADDDTTGYSFLGFAVTSGTAGNTVYVQTDGIVSGFSGLDIGENYYVSNTVGGIATSSADYTNPMKVGIAISATQIAIHREKTGGSLASKSNNTDYTALTDGFAYCTAYGNAGGSAAMTGYINGAAILYDDGIAVGADSAISFFVKKGETWKCNGSAGTIAISWRPFN
jgi:hypothetical protein